VNESHSLVLQSPEPTARRFPVGESDTHDFGEVWPVGGTWKSATRRDGEIGGTMEPRRERDAPKGVEERRVADRTSRAA